MQTITPTQKFFNLTCQQIPKQLRSLYEFGFKAISLQPIVSLNSNARCTVANQNTAESKIYRLTSNQRFLSVLPAMVKCLNLVKPGDKINVDFSGFKDGKQVLMFAKQTNEGRAMPLYFEELKYPIETEPQNIFILNAIQNFLNLIGNIKVKFVFDRGFASPYIARRLAENGLIFYLRIKKAKNVILPNSQKEQAVEKVRFKDQNVLIYGQDLRLVRSDKPVNDNNQPWYIITNDYQSTRNEVIKIYYHRFEVEELFKDAKHFFGLERLKTRKELSFKIVLWFVIIGIWLSWFLHQLLAKGKRLMKKYHKKYSLSIIKYWLEKVHLDIRLATLSKICLDPG